MRCWNWCGWQHIMGISKLPIGNENNCGRKDLAETVAEKHVEEQALETDEHCNWFFQESQVPDKEGELEDEPLIVRAISGAEITSLSPRVSENALDVKGRIQKKEGTAVFMQKLVQGCKILEDKDLVGREPLVLVRVPRKRILIASLHADLRSYDLETGATMRTVPSQFLQISCMIVDWERFRCFTGSVDGSVRVWDVYSNECLGTLSGLQAKISALSFDNHERLVAIDVTGNVRTWTLDLAGFENARAKRSKAWHVDITGDILLAISWERSLAVVSGKDSTSKHVVAAYGLQSCSRVWFWNLKGPTPTLNVDWEGQQCLTAPWHDFFELRKLGDSAQEYPRQFAHQRIHRKGLVSADWVNELIVFISEPFGVELWSLATCEMLYSVRDTSGDTAQVVSLDVDWGQYAPQVITCRTYMDWESIAGEVSIQHWDMQEDGDLKCVSAEHPMIGGFDVVAAVAQVCA